MYAVIMASGQGSRLWPLSRQKKPKQFHAFVSDKSLIRETFERLRMKFETEKIFIAVIKDYLSEAKSQVPELPEENFIIEPCGVSTTATCGMAILELAKRDSEASAIFVPSDHLITEPEKFIETVNFAEKEVAAFPDNIILIGINPTRPDTGMGYIQMNSQIESDGNYKIFSVKKFVEKPDAEHAEEYLASWDHLWNAGMFVWKLSNIIGLYEKFIPKTYDQLLEIRQKIAQKDDEKTIAKLYGGLEKDSIDYSIIEKTEKVMVVPANFGWSDVGSWNALVELLTEKHGAHIVSKGNHISVNDKNCLVMAGDKLIATVGLKDMVIIDTPDAVLVCNAKEAQSVKTLIQKLKDEGKHLYL